MSAGVRSRPIAGIVFVLAVIATVVIVNGGDSASTSATVVAAAEPQHVAAAGAGPAAGDRHHHDADVTSAQPDRHQHRATDAPAAGNRPAGGTGRGRRTFVYRVAGTKGLLDLVTVVYTDASGAPQTDFNVSLPWSRTVVLNPGVSCGQSSRRA